MTKEPTQEQAAGMTVNERLWLFGLMDAFDNAVAEKDEAALKSILEKIYLTPANIQIILEQQIK